MNFNLDAMSFMQKIHEGELSTPPKIDEDVDAFRLYVRSSELPFFVPVQPFSWARVNCCDLNVRKAVKETGGKEILGFRIWSIPRWYIEADLHCIWQKPDGEIIDVTPNKDGEQRTLFLPEPKLRTVRLSRRGDKPRLALKESLYEAVAMMIATEKRIRCQYPPDEVLWATSLTYKQMKRQSRKRRA